MTQFERLAQKNGVDKEIAINELKSILQKYDYIGTKIATGVATIEEYSDQIAYCESVRQQIRELESV